MWIIQDWMSQRVFDDKSFDSFDEARGFITEHANETSTSEREFDGICEDLYAIEMLDPLETITIETREQALAYALHWKQWVSEQTDWAWGELSRWGDAMDKLAERFDLTDADEFTENGII